MIGQTQITLVEGNSTNEQFFLSKQVNQANLSADRWMITTLRAEATFLQCELKCVVISTFSMPAHRAKM